MISISDSYYYKPNIMKEDITMGAIVSEQDNIAFPDHL
jgi:hypothetical protein